MDKLKEEKLISSNKLYYILSSIGLSLSIVSISLLFSLDYLWVNIGLSIICMTYAVIFVALYLKKETNENNNIMRILGWMMLIVAVALTVTVIFIGSVDETNSLPFLKILFIAIDITPGIYLIIKFIVFLVTSPGW